MKPVIFNQANGALIGGPAEQFNTDDIVDDLPVYRDGSEVISCWRPDLRERFDILLRGRVWLRVSAATTHPPVCLEGRSPFSEDSRWMKGVGALRDLMPEGQCRDSLSEYQGRLHARRTGEA